MREYTITKEENNVRLDKFVKKVLSEAPLSVIYKLFRKKDIKVNGKPANDKTPLKEGDIVRIYLVEDKFVDFEKKKEIKINSYRFKTIYEDDNIIVVSKPIGMIVHDAEDPKEHTLTDEVVSYLIMTRKYNPSTNSFTPAPAHRLDRNTSGLVIYGKNMETLQTLNEMFKNRTNISKKYLALVCGEVTKEGKVDLPLSKDSKENTVKVDRKNGKTALTLYKPICTNGKYSLVELELMTGRTHQIRVHMSAIGYPLIGDKKYGNFKENSLFEKEFDWKFQFLHAYSLKFYGLEGKLEYLNNMCIVDEFDDKKQKIKEELFKRS